MTELQMLKGDQSTNHKSDFQVEQVRKERNELQEENRRLVQMLKDNRKWDLYVLQRENERLMNQVQSSKYSDASLGMGPASGENKNFASKVKE